MRITWLGHSCVLLEGSRTVLIDPYVPTTQITCRPDIVAVTHAHADHLGVTLELSAVTVAMNELSHYLKGKGLSVEPMNIGGTITVQGVTFTMTQALHSSWIEDAGIGVYGGAAAGYLITMDGICVYHAGDTGLFGDMRLIGEIYNPDVALLPIGGRYTMGPREAMIAAEFIGAPVVIPIHYNTTPRIVQDAEAFRSAIERTTDLKVMVLSPGGSYEPVQT
ncbi:MAG TPA: metal-dependent hydrolase [Methanospirillum sp.]|nr:metal-dependent hydrolase [Methanospirillum sp.]